MGGGTGCVLKQVKILHGDAQILHKILKNFPQETTPTFPPLFQILLSHGSDRQTAPSFCLSFTTAVPNCESTSLPVQAECGLMKRSLRREFS